MGRFTGMDPFGGNGSDPASLHRYLYAYASPISNTDPTGLFTLPSLATISAVLTTINTISLVTTAAVFGYRAGTIGNDLLIEEKIELEDALEDVADLGGDIALSIAGYRLLNFEGLKFAGSLMRKLPSMAGRIKLWNVAHVNGRLAEHYIGNAYGLFRNNLPIPSGRVPDFVHELATPRDQERHSTEMDTAACRHGRFLRGDRAEVLPSRETGHPGRGESRE